MSTIYGEKGGKSSSSKTSSITEAPNTLQSNSIARILDVIGEGEIVGLVDGMKSVYLDETPLQNSDDSYNFDGVVIETRTGTTDQSYIAGFPSVETATSISTQVTQETPAIRTITTQAANAARVTLLIPALTEQNTSTGDINGTSVAIAIDVRPNGGDWSEAVYDIIEGKTTSDYERSYRVELDDTGPWDIRMRRITADSDSSFLNNETYWSTLTEIIDAKLTYPDTALVGITVNAEDFGDSIPSRSYLVKGRIIQVPSNYDPDTREYTGIWDGTFKMAWSDNPAWVYYDIATNKRFGAGIDNVDKWGLYTIAQYCDELVPNGYGDDEPRFTFNTVLSSQEEAFDALNLISSCFRGMTYWGTNTVVAVADMPSDPVKLVTPSNVIDGEFEYSGTGLSARHSQVLVTWNDPESNYEEAIEVVEDPELIEKYGIRQLDITAVGCTSRGQARRMGLWTLYSEKAETETISYQASIDHVDMRPGDIVKVSDPSIAGARLGGRVRVTGTTELELDKRPDEASGQDWFLDVVMPAGGIETREVTSFDGNKVTLSQPLSQEPVKAAQWILRSTSVEPRQFRVLSITEDGDNIYTVTGIEYDPTKYARVEEGLILDDPDYSLLPSGAISAPYNITAVTSTYIAGNTQHQKLTISWTASDDPRVQTYQCEFISPDDATWQSGYNNGGLSFDVMDISPGEWQIRVRGLSALGVASPWVSLTTTISGLLEPNAPTSVDVEVGTFQIKLSPSGGKAGQEWQYWRSDVALADESLIETNAVLRTQTNGSYIDTGLDPLTTYYYYIRGANNYGVSGWYPVQATTEGDATAILTALSGKITETQLYQDLNERIDQIEVNATDIVTANTLREDGDEALAEQINTVSATLGDADAVIQQRLTAQVTGRSLVVDGSFTSGDGSLWNDISAVTIEPRDTEGTTLRANTPASNFALFADANQGTTRNVIATFTDVSEGDLYSCSFWFARANSGNGTLSMTVQWYTADNTLVSWPTVLSESLSSYTNSVWQSSDDVTITAPAGATKGRVVMRLGSDNTVGQAAFTAVKAGIADKALSEKVDTVQAALGDDIASVEQSLSAEVDAVEGTVSALYTLRTDVNGRVAGFGLSNDGATSAFGIVADQFYIADPDDSVNEVIPFIFDNGVAYIQEALIGSLTFNKLTDDTGTFIVENGKLQAEYIQADELEVEWANIQNVSIGTADIETAAITSAKIDDLAVTSAKIGTAAVDTLQIAGDAVTVPVSSYTANQQAISQQGAWTNIASITINPNNAPVALSFNTAVYVWVNTSAASDAGAIAEAEISFKITKDGADFLSLGVVQAAKMSGAENSTTNFARAEIQQIISGGYRDSATGTTRTYALWAKVDGTWDNVVNMYAVRRFMQALGTKR